MPLYSIQGPDGKTYSIEGPAGATREEVIAQIQARLATQKEPESTGILSSLKQGAYESIRGLGQTAQTIAGGTPEAEAEKPKTIGERGFLEDASFAHPLDTLYNWAQKGAYQLGKGAPELVGAEVLGATGAEIGAVGGAPGAIAGGIAGAGLGAGAMNMAKNLGPFYAEELKNNPDNPDLAFDLAIERAEREGGITAVSFGAFKIAPFKSAVKNILAQAFAIQPAISSGATALENVEAGRDITEGITPESYAETALANVLPAGVMHGLSAYRGSREAKRAEEAAQRAAEEVPGINEETGQMTFAPKLFGEEAAPAEAPTRPEGTMEATIGDQTITGTPTYVNKVVRTMKENDIPLDEAKARVDAAEEIKAAREAEKPAEVAPTEAVPEEAGPTPYSGQEDMFGAPTGGLFGTDLLAQRRFDLEAEAKQREAGEALRAAREETPVETPVVETPVVETPIAEEAPISRAAEVTGLGDKYTALVDAIHLKVDPKTQWITPNFVARELNIDLPQAKDVMKDLETDGYISNPNKSGWYKPTEKVAAEAKPIPRARMIGGAGVAEEPIRRAPMMGGRNIVVEEQRRAPMIGGRNAIAEPETGRARMMGGRNLLAEETVEPTVETPRRARMLGGRNLLTEETANAPNIKTNAERAAERVIGERTNERRVPASNEQLVQPRRAGEPSVETTGGERLAIDKSVTPKPAEGAGTRPVTLEAQAADALERARLQRRAEERAKEAAAIEGISLQERQASEATRVATQSAEQTARVADANKMEADLAKIAPALHPNKVARIKSAIQQVKDGVRNAATVRHMLGTAQPASRMQLIAHMAKKAQEPRTQLGETTGTGVDVETARSVAGNVVKDWKNAPAINVVKSIAELPEHLRGVDPTARGLYDPSTKTVHVIADNTHAANSEASIKSTVFHESLGHFGLERAFGNGLDALLNNLHKTNKTVRDRTNAWLERNPDAYKDSADRTARAVEEVFAEMSERGETKAPTGLHLAFNKVTDYIRGFLERMGLKQKDYGKAEMREIVDTLQRAHESVTGGKAGVAERAEKTVTPEVRYQKQSEGVIEDDIPEDSGTAKLAEAARKVQEARAAGKPKEELARYGDADLHLPTMDKSRKARAFAALSKLDTTAKDGVQDLWSLHQKHVMYGDKLPSIELLDERVNTRGADFRAAQKAIGDQEVKWLKTVAEIEKKSPLMMNNFYDIALRSTLDQVEFSNRKAIYDAKGNLIQRGRVREDGELTRRFEALPKELRDMYMEIRDSYEGMMDEYTKFVLARMGKDEADKYRAEYESGRLGVYLPLFRKGEFWLSYTDKANNPVKTSFNTEFERNAEVARVKASGIKDVDTYRNIRELRERSTPPVGFLGEILKTLKEHDITDPEILDAMYEKYLDYIPAGSLRQRMRTRERYLGMEPDIISTYANVAPTMARALTSLKHAAGIDEAMSKIKAEGLKNRSDENLTRVVDGIERQVNFIRNPRPYSTGAKVANAAGYGSYLWYLAGNASSALIDLTHLPMVVYPKLGGDYGYGKTSAAFTKAMAKVSHLSTEEVVPKGYEDLFTTAKKTGAIGLHVPQELFDLKNMRATDYTTTGAKIRATMDYMFRKTGMMNREGTLIAAYDLEFARSGDATAAQRVAIKTVKDAYGSALTEAGPRIMQNNAARVALTFKSFALNRLFVLGRMFRDAWVNDTPRAREIAIKQVLGIYGMAFLFSGVSGMPGVGLGQFLANQLGGDEDHPYDAETRMRVAMGDWIYKGPLAHAFNLAVSDRTGWNDMIWRDDPRRLADVGIVDYTLGLTLGPIYSAVSQIGDAFDYYKQGEYDRMFESMTPVAIRNVFKAIRYARDGAKTVSGKPIGDVSTYNVVMQGLGFAPEDISERRKIATSIDLEQKKILARKSELIGQAVKAIRAGKFDEYKAMVPEFIKFSQANPEVGITPADVKNAVASSARKEGQSVLGINPSLKLRNRLLQEQGFDYRGEPAKE